MLSVARELTQYRISRTFACREKVNAVSFLEALEYFGYRDSVMDKLRDIRPSNLLSRFSLRTRVFMARKNLSRHGVWAVGTRSGFNWLQRPIEKIG
jgi:hypothetical protein